MSMGALDVQKRQERRYQLLPELWKAAAGKQLERVDFLQVAANAGFDYEEARQIYLFFKDEGFFEVRTQLWGVTMSHKAIKEIERSMANPNEATEHFSATVIQNFNAPVGAVLTGPKSTANVNQNFGPSIGEVAELITQLREQFGTLPRGPREEAIDVINGLKEELQQPVPSRGKVRAFLTQVGVFAQDMASGASAALLADAVAKYLGLSRT